MIELTPPPVDLAELVFRVVGQRWPTTMAERDAMLRRIGLKVVPGKARTPSDDPRLTFQSVEIPLPAVTCSASMVDDEFLGLSLFAYAERQPAGQQAKSAADELRRLFSARIGNPVEEWGPPGEPACYWEIGLLGVELYCFQHRHSDVMIAIDHVQRSQAYEASRK